MQRDYDYDPRLIAPPTFVDTMVVPRAGTAEVGAVVIRARAHVLFADPLGI